MRAPCYFPKRFVNLPALLSIRISHLLWRNIRSSVSLIRISKRRSVGVNLIRCNKCWPVERVFSLRTGYK